MEDYLKELEETRKALLNILEDVEEARRETGEERDKIKAIIANLADGLIVFDSENRIILINSQGEKFLDIKTGEVEGKTLGEFSEKISIKKLAELISKKGNLFREELALEEPKEIVLEVTTVPLTSRKEKVVILHDITREKLIDRMKTEFVSFSAHQLKTPLASIKWALKMILDGSLGKITKNQKDIISKTYQVNEKMISLINDLLNLARIEEGRYLYKPILTQIEEIIQSVIDSCQEEIKRKKIKVKFEKPKEKLPKIKVDVEKIQLAIENFLGNAIKYTPTDGEVTVFLDYSKPKFDISSGARYNKNEIQFSVKDSGIGIPESQKEKIFTKFFRAANAIKMKSEGTGLGLFITKNIIEAHGGRVWFESEEGKGTTFHFTLPLQ